MLGLAGRGDPRYLCTLNVLSMFEQEHHCAQAVGVSVSDMSGEERVK
jgi:hypothetical protein